MARPRSFVLALVMFAAAVGACAGNMGVVPTSECSSGLQWLGGDSGNALMHPGRDCIGCHASAGKGPRYALAGTVFGDAAAKDDCYGRTDVVVRVTGADGKFVDLTPNGAGNFTVRGGVALPYTAELRRGETVIGKMQTAQTSGACNGCHTAEGSPGRIVAP